MSADRKDWVRHSLEMIRSSETAMGVSLAIVVGLGAGTGAVIFRWLIAAFQTLFFAKLGTLLGFLGQYYVILVPAIGGLIVGPIIYFFAREAKGHGVPEVMLAVATKGGQIRPRVAVIKSLASSICIGSGGSVGREGPIVQIGSSIGSTLGQWLHLPEEWTSMLVACGAAGGISATFNAPIAGVFFALEVILRRFTTRSFAFVVLSSVTADMVARAFLGNEQSFSVPAYSMVSPWEILSYIILGILAALVAVTFSRGLYKCEDLFDRLRFPEYLKPVLGGIAIGFIGLYNSDLFGVGYNGIERALVGHLGLSVLLIMLVLKIAATSFTLGSGGSGGVFAPSLFIGSMLGGSFGELVHRLFPTITASSGAYAMVGMGAVFAGAAHAPITAIIILFEMTGDYAIILPLMASVVISTLLSRRLNHESIYTTKLRRAGVKLEEEAVIDPMRLITVQEAMTDSFQSVSPNMLTSELLARFIATGQHGFPVVDDEGQLRGIVTLVDIENALRMDGGKQVTVNDVATKTIVTVYPDETLYDAVQRAGAGELAQLPVVDRQDRMRLVGMLRRSDITKAYAKAMQERTNFEKRTESLNLTNIPDTKLIEVTIGEGSSIIGKRLEELNLPGDCLVISIRRAAHTTLAHGNTTFEKDDRVIVLTTLPSAQEVLNLLDRSLVDGE